MHTLKSALATQRIWSLALVLLLAAFLAVGCSITTSDGDSDSSSDSSSDGDSTSSGDDGDDDDEITFLNPSGDAVGADGVWEMCTDGEGDADSLERQTFDGTSLVIANYTYDSTDGTCEGNETVDEDSTNATLTLEQGEDVTLVGWSDGSDTTDAPDAADGSGALDETPDVSLVNASGDLTGVLARMIDDTGDTYRMYRDHGEPSDVCELDDEDYDGCLHAIDYLELVD